MISNEAGSHELLQVVEGDKTTDLCRAALNQSAVKNRSTKVINNIQILKKY